MDSRALRILLVDDRPHALRGMTSTLRAHSDVDIIGTASDGDAAVGEAQRLSPDLVILDMEMGEHSGLSIAVELQRDGINPEINILSGFDKYATVAFEVEALDFLVKPLRLDRLRQAIELARRRCAEKSAHLSLIESNAQNLKEPTIHIPDRNGGSDVSFSLIIWIKAAKGYALTHTRKRTHILRITMSELADRLPKKTSRPPLSICGSFASSSVRSLDKGICRLTLSDQTEVKVGPSSPKKCPFRTSIAQPLIHISSNGNM